MHNFQITAKEDNKKYWISRSIAVASFIFFKEKDGSLFVLANKRGKGTPDFQGMWNCPCGYLDFDETLEQAASREVFEETGVIIDPKKFIFHYINSDPKDSNKQNVTVRFKVFLSKRPETMPRFGGEQNEVDKILWIPVKTIDKFKWAFNHDRIIKEIVKNN